MINMALLSLPACLLKGLKSVVVVFSFYWLLKFNTVKISIKHPWLMSEELN